MWRLTPPTKTTFGLSVVAIGAGIAAQLGLVDLADITELEDVAFWLTAGGAIVMTFGVLFRKI